MNSLFFFIKKLATHKSELLLGLLLGLILAFSSIALLTLSGWFIASSAFAGLTAATAANFNYFLPAASIRFLALTRILSRYFDRVINHEFTFRILADLRVWFYQKIIPLAPAKLLQHRSGDLLNRIVNDIDTLDHLYLNVLSPFLMSAVITVVIALFIAHFSVTLSCIALLAILFSAGLITILTLLKTKKIGSYLQKTTADLRTGIVNAMQGFVDLLLFVKKENRVKLLDAQHNALISAQKQAAKLKGFVMAAMAFFSGIAVLLTLFFGIPLVQHQEITGAQLAMIVLLVIVAFEQLTSLPLACFALGKTAAAAKRLLLIATEKPAVVYSDGDSDGDGDGDGDSDSDGDGDSDYSLRLNNIAFKPHGFSIENITIPMNTHFGITGDSGSGKTTLLNLMARVFDPTSGEIMLGNQNLKNMSENDLRKKISLVTQQVHIFNASVKDNLTLFNNEISDDACFDVLQKMDLADLIHTLPEKLNSQMGEFGKQFSGGQIRRIAIARALLQNTPIILLDEPSTGLDDALMDRVWKKCEDLFSKKTVVVATHDQRLLSHVSRVIAIPMQTEVVFQ